MTTERGQTTSILSRKDEKKNTGVQNDFILDTLQILLQ